MDKLKYSQISSDILIEQRKGGEIKVTPLSFLGREYVKAKKGVYMKSCFLMNYHIEEMLRLQLTIIEDFTYLPI